MPRLWSLPELLRHTFAIAPGRRRTKNARNPLRRCLQLEALEDRLVPAGDILVTGSLSNVGNVFQEYTPAGALVRTLTVPPPPNDSFTSVASIAQDANGNVYVWDGRSTLALAVYNAQSGDWSQLTYPQGWSTAYQSGQTGVAVYGHYAYVSNETGPSGQPTLGVIRFDLDTGIGTDFNPFNSGTVSVAMGLDGNLYALGYNTVYELDPNTMALENTINLPSESYIGLAVDAAGDIYMASSDGTIDSFDPTGTQIATTTLAGNPASIAIASDGTLAVGTRFDGVVRMTSAFTNVTTFNVADGGDNVAFAQVAPPGPASPAQSIITFAPGTVQSGTMTATVTLTAKDSNGYRENAGGLDVQFGVGAGTANGIFTGLTDNGDGTYTAIFTGTTPGTNTITTSINGQPLTSTLPSVTVTPSTPAGDILVTTQPSNGTPAFEELTQTGTVVQSVPVPPVPNEGFALAEDPSGNVYVFTGTGSHDIAVYHPSTSTWTSLTYFGWGNGAFGLALDDNYAYTANSTNQSGTSSGGIIRFDLTTGQPTRFNSYGLDLWDANIGLDGNLYALTGGAGADSILEINPITMALERTIDVPYHDFRGMVVNASGDIFAVEWEGTVDHYSPTGQLLDTVTLENGVGGLDSIAIASDGTLAVGTNSGTVVRMTSAFTNITELAGGDYVAFAPTQPPPGSASPARSVVTVSPTSIALNGTATITLQARDANGTAVTTGGLTVSFSLGAGPAIGSIGPITDNNDGTYTATFTAGTYAGTNTITAAISGVAVTSTPPRVTVAPGPSSLAQSTVSVAPTAVTAGGTAIVTLHAEDAFGNDETSGGLTVAFALGNGVGSGAFGSVNDHGNGTYTAVFTGTTIGANTITATISTQAVTSPAPSITVTQGPLSPSLSTISIAPNTIPAGTAATITLTLVDAGGNPFLGSASIVFTITGAAGGSFSGATNIGNGVYTATFTGTTAGSGTIGAKINGIALTSALPSVMVTPLALDHFKVAAGNGVVTVTAQDVYNNTAPSFTGSVHLASVNNKSAPIDYAYSPGADAGQHQFNLATATGVDVTNLSNFAGAAPANVAVQANINLTAGQYAGLLTRYSGPTDKSFYFGGIIPNPNGHGFVAAVWINKTGSLTGLTALVPMTSVQGTLYFETVGTSLQLFWRPTSTGTLTLLTAVNDASLSGGTVGVRIGQGVTVSDVLATAVSSSPASFTFSENFVPGNYPTTFNAGLSSSWQDQQGVVSIVNGAGVGRLALNVATLNGINTANEYAQAVINVQRGQSAGLVVRYQGTGNHDMYYGAIVSSGTKFDAEIGITLNGVSKLLTVATPISGGGQGTLLFVAVGSSLRLFWQPAGVTGFSLVASATNTSLTTGSVGVRIGAGASLTSFQADVATPPPPQNATLAFSEDFTNPSYPNGLGSQLSSYWQNQAGDLSIVNSNAAGSASLNEATLNGVNVANVSVQAVVNVPAGEFAGLVSRYKGTGDRNMYFAEIAASGSGYVASIWMNLNGVWTRLTPLTSIGTVGQGTLQFTTSGSSLQLFWNGTLIVSATNTRLTTGSVGVRVGQGAALANFSAS
jgi:sugar lactone lactonase YvrE